MGIKTEEGRTGMRVRGDVGEDGIRSQGERVMNGKSAGR